MMKPLHPTRSGTDPWCFHGVAVLVTIVCFYGKAQRSFLLVSKVNSKYIDMCAKPLHFLVLYYYFVPFYLVLDMDESSQLFVCPCCPLF